MTRIDSEPRVWSVGALCLAIADTLNARFNPVAVKGEISGFSRAASGHCYFNLKDESGQIRCAMFKRAASALGFMPKDGEMVELRGKLGVYEARGDLQLVVETMQRAGQGDLFAQFLKLKANLEAEGLFDASRKRDIPAQPRAIGVITSLGAAALHDVVSALQRRVPHIPVIVAPASVQGIFAPAELLQSLKKLVSWQGSFSTQPLSIDVILMVRGGGSMEDLWAFNDEALGIVSRKAIERRTGARGLRSIRESVLLDTMFELPGLDGVEQVVVGAEVIEGKAKPLYIYGERKEELGATA
jgi:exodeoxyribonuclease VII large subunit